MSLFFCQLAWGQITYTHIPKNKQLYPRDLGSNTASVIIAGSVDATGLPGVDEMEVKVLRDGASFTTVSQVLSYTGNVASFSLEVVITAELKNYTFEICGISGGSHAVYETIQEVVAGDAYFVTGQSNASGAMYSAAELDLTVLGDGSCVGSANTDAGTARDFIRSFGDGRSTRRNKNIAECTGSAFIADCPTILAAVADENWYTADGDLFYHQGTIAQWPLRMAKNIVETEGIPVAIINGATGGEVSQHFLRDDDDTENIETQYGRQLLRIRNSGLADAIRAVFWYQGESDAAVPVSQHTWAPGKWENNVKALRSDWMEDFANLSNIYLIQIRASPDDPNLSEADQESFRSLNLAIRLRHDKIANQFANTTLIRTAGIDGHDGIHYCWETGYKVLGDRIYDQVSVDLYGATGVTLPDPPIAGGATFTSGDNRTLQLAISNPGVGLVIESGAYEDFIVEGSNAEVIGGVVSGDGQSVILTLDKNACDLSPDCSGVGLSYNGHAGPGGWVTNTSGDPLLLFANTAITGGTPAILPVELVEFTAKAEAGGVRLNWTTATEVNNDHFTIERSADAVIYEALTRIQGQGTTTSTTSYEAWDQRPLEGRAYYRLKQVDIDGSSTYSEVVEVQSGTSLTDQFESYPNPTRGQLFIQKRNSDQRTYPFRLLNIAGKMLHHGLIQEEKVSISLTDLTPGIYILEVSDANQTLYREKVQVLPL